MNQSSVLDNLLGFSMLLNNQTKFNPCFIHSKRVHNTSPDLPWSCLTLVIHLLLTSAPINLASYITLQYILRLQCREEENLVFCFGTQFNSTLNFTQSGWLILFSPDVHFRLAKRVSSQNPLSSAWDGDQNRRSSGRPCSAMLFN